MADIGVGPGSIGFVADTGGGTRDMGGGNCSENGDMVR